MDTDVVISGGGPVGLMLACELRLAGVDVVVAERRTTIDETIKAGGMAQPAAEALYRRGLLTELEERAGQNFEHMKASFARLGNAPGSMPRPVGHFAGIMIGGDRVDLDDPGFRDGGRVAGCMGVNEQALAEVLAGRAAELGIGCRRGAEVTGFDAAADGVTVQRGETSLRAASLVGCDGGRSLVRKLAGFDFPGTAPEITGRQALVELEGASLLRPGWNRTDRGIYVHGPLPGRILTVESGPPEDREAEITAEEIEASLRRVSGMDVHVTAVRTATRFTDNARQATTYRLGRVLLAGDAAHVHSPFGGQGLNLGICDAANLGWKLAATIHGWAPEGLLDSYTTERHPIGEWVLEWTRAQVALMRPDPQTRALRAVVTDLLETRDGATYLGKKLSGVLHRYPIEGDHDLVGRGAPDFAFADGTRLGEHLQDGRGLLLDLAENASMRELGAGWADRVRTLTAKCVSEPSLTGVLIRPDGHIAWAREDGTTDGLEAALTTCFGNVG